MAGHVAQPIGTLHPNIAPYGEVFTCSDRKRIVLAVGSNAQFRKLCEALELPAVKNDADFAENNSRVVNRARLAELLAPAIATFPREPLLEKLQTRGVPAGAVNSIDAALSSPSAKRMTREEMLDGIRTLRIRAATPSGASIFKGRGGARIRTGGLGWGVLSRES